MLEIKNVQNTNNPKNCRYCDAPGISSDTIDTKQCDPGYFCDYGSISATEANCGKGYYCEQGTDRRVPCPEGL